MHTFVQAQPQPRRPHSRRRQVQGVQHYCGGQGRPVDLEVLADGSMLVADEMNSLVRRGTTV